MSNDLRVRIARDRSLRPQLTVPQVVALAQLSTPEGRHNADGMAILEALWNAGLDTHNVLARWIVDELPKFLPRAEAERAVLQAAWRYALDFEATRESAGAHG